MEQLKDIQMVQQVVLEQVACLQEHLQELPVEELLQSPLVAEELQDLVDKTMEMLDQILE